jgi:rubrerythrin
MIRLQRSVITAIQAAKDPADLYPWLQNAIELEHSTIPPYLTALFSLMPGTNAEIARLIHSIVIEEMLHMTIASNILIAIKGHPSINGADFIPKYPGP